jgi:hypothetical protein
MGPHAGRYGEKPPAENASVNRVSSRSQYRHNRTCQDGDDEVKHLLFPGERKREELYHTAERCAIGGQNPKAQVLGTECHGEEYPKRCPERRVSCSVYQECCGDGGPEDEQSSTWYSRGKHGKQSLHRREVIPAGVAGQSR